MEINAAKSSLLDSEVSRGFPRSCKSYGLRKQKLSSLAPLSVSNLEFKEPRAKQKRVPKVTSVTSFLTPLRSVKTVRHALRRSFSLMVNSSPSSSRLQVCNIGADGSFTELSSASKRVFASRTCRLPFAKKRSYHSVTDGSDQPDCSIFTTPVSAAIGHCSRLWMDTLPRAAAQEMKAKLGCHEIQRQEAIFELFQGEAGLVEDLKTAQEAYYNSVHHGFLQQQQELRCIFFRLHNLLDLHEASVENLKLVKSQDGTTVSVGSILMDWVPRLQTYVNYCADLTRTRVLLDERRTKDTKLDEFLLQQLESPYGRRLDLWSFLDAPRSHLVKYPLLLRSILKHTPEDNMDKMLLPEVITRVESIINLVDRQMGRATCKLVLSQLFYLDEDQKCDFISRSTTVVCSGVLRNNRGTKLNVFLFDTGIVLTRPTTRSNNLCYQVYRQPISAQQLCIEDIADGETKPRGSFKNAFTPCPSVKNALRVSSKERVLGQSHTLQAHDQHDKKQWLRCLMQVANQNSQLSSGANDTLYSSDDDDGGFLKRPILL